MKRKSKKEEELVTSVKRDIQSKSTNKGYRCSPFLHLTYGYPYALSGCLPYGAVYFLFNLVMKFLQVMSPAAARSKPSTKGLSVIIKNNKKNAPLLLYQMEGQVQSLVEQIKSNNTRLTNVRQSFSVMTGLILWFLKKHTDKAKKDTAIVYSDRVRMQYLLGVYGDMFLDSTTQQRVQIDVDVIFTKYYAPCLKELQRESRVISRADSFSTGERPFEYLNEMQTRTSGLRGTALLALLRNLSAHRLLDTPGYINLSDCKNEKEAAIQGRLAAKQVVYHGSEKLAGKVFLVQLENNAVFGVIIVFMTAKATVLFCNQLKKRATLKNVEEEEEGVAYLRSAHAALRLEMELGKKGPVEEQLDIQYPPKSNKDYWGRGILPRDDLQLILYVYNRLIRGYTHTQARQHMVKIGMFCPNKSVTDLRQYIGVQSGDSEGCYVSASVTTTSKQ